VDEVRRPVERVDYPVPSGIAGGAPPFFTEEAVARERRCNQRLKQRLALPIRRGDQVDCALVFNGLEPAEVPEKDRPGVTSGAHGQLEARLHRPWERLEGREAVLRQHWRRGGHHWRRGGHPWRGELA